MNKHKGKVTSLASAISNQPLRQIFFAIGLQLDEITSKLEDLEDEVKDLKKKKKKDDD